MLVLYTKLTLVFGVSFISGVGKSLVGNYPLLTRMVCALRKRSSFITHEHSTAVFALLRQLHREALLYYYVYRETTGMGKKLNHLDIEYALITYVYIYIYMGRSIKLCMNEENSFGLGLNLTIGFLFHSAVIIQWLKAWPYVHHSLFYFHSLFCSHYCI